GPDAAARGPAPPSLSARAPAFQTSGSRESEPLPTSNVDREKYAASPRVNQSVSDRAALPVAPYTASIASWSAASGAVPGRLRIRAPVRHETSSTGLANGR